jgi:hypothetical protein
MGSRTQNRLMNATDALISRADRDAVQTEPALAERSYLVKTILARIL